MAAVHFLYSRRIFVKDSGTFGGGPAVSVLLPCRDAAQYLPQTIASLEAQSFENYQVIAVDDGSRDDTAACLADWARRDPRVKVAGGKGRGVVAALATALGLARAPIIARMDADDVAEPRRFERQLAYLAEHPRLVACGTRIRYFPRQVVGEGLRRYEAWINTLVEPELVARDIFIECPIPHPTLMIRREALLSVGGYRDCGWPEDYDLCLRLWEAGNSMANVPEVLLHWREHAGRVSRRDQRYVLEAFCRCKVHFLLRSLLRRRQGAVVWGAGPVGKRFGRELRRQGVSLRAFVDLDPRKIGQHIHGAPVVAPRQIGEYRQSLVLAAVGSPGARDEIREDLSLSGWTEGLDFCVVA